MDAETGRQVTERERVGDGGAVAGRPGGGASLPLRAPGRRPNSVPPFVPRGPGVPLQVGERSGGGGGSRAARPAGGARSARARGPARLGDSGSGRRGRGPLRPPRAAHCSAGPAAAAGRAAKVGGGRAAGGGRRRASARRVVGVSGFCFLQTLLGRSLAGCRGDPLPVPPRGPPGRSGRRRLQPGTRACGRRAPCNLSAPLLPGPGGAGHLPAAAAALLAAPGRPARPPARAGPARTAPGSRRRRRGAGGAAEGGGDRPGNLRERRRVAGGPLRGRGTRGGTDPTGRARAPGSPAPPSPRTARGNRGQSGVSGGVRPEPRSIPSGVAR